MAAESALSGERPRIVSLSSGSVFVHRLMQEPFLVYDVGTTHPSLSLRACRIFSAGQNRINFPEPVSPAEVEKVLREAWPEERIITAFIRSYGFRSNEARDVLLMAHRGPRIFEI